MILLFLKAYWKHIAVLLALFFVGHSIYSWGARNNEEKWVERLAKRDAIQAEQNKEIGKLSSTVVAAATAQTKLQAENVAKILLSIKNKPLYELKDGKCVFSNDFEKAYNDIIISK